ncbi:MAG: saccharopine dehydrogenase family protein [Polyangiaceae bacterium]
MPTPIAKSSRPYDVVVWGATGFTGRLVAEYIAQHYGAKRDLRWAIAGRSRDKLAQIRDSLVAIDPAARDLPLLVGDGRDRASLDPIVSSTRVVATTVGPYAIHGHELAASCAENGTDSCDLTGEPQFVVSTIERHHARARETGARLVHCCGFDSIPSDLGVLLLQNEMQARHGTRCSEVKYFLAKMKGGFSGGTAASALHVAEEMAHDPSVRRIIGNPYALDPERTDRGPDGQDQRGVRWDDDLQTWTGPFMMAAINTRIVRRSNALLGYAWGKDFRYSECAAFSKGPGGLLAATAMSVGFGVFFVLAALGPTRTLLAGMVPSPGEGPTKEQRDAGFFVVKLVGISEGDSGARTHRLLGTVRGQSDPGYGETAKMLTESAVCLAKDDLDVPGGVLTPASSMGMKLVERLRRAGMTFDVEPMSDPGA